MKKIDIAEINTWYALNYEKGIESRRVTLDQIKPYLAGLDTPFDVIKIGESHEKRDIYKLQFGKGSKQILLWTQMHGNESTGTKAFLDLIKMFMQPGSFEWLTNLILKECTVHCIPILNPDGAEKYTRVNAQDIDLNRDVIDLKAEESKILQNMLKQIDPCYCFNMHDQRTIFSVGPEIRPATVSFLAPSVDVERTLTPGRIQTMSVITSMNKLLQQYIPGSIGRYTDEFYPTAAGDNFQKMGHNTILIESGHAVGDYQRKVSRKLSFIAIMEGLRYIAEPDNDIDYQEYFKIPNNEKKYLDIIVKKIGLGKEKTDLGILFVEKIKDGEVTFIPSIDKLEDLSGYNADKIIDGSENVFDSTNEVEKWIFERYN
jgi:hypothetical protein